jgi:L-alanine-DL-glutamate epimerase-like enolase superfamily enzyme
MIDASGHDEASANGVFVDDAAQISAHNSDNTKGAGLGTRITKIEVSKLRLPLTVPYKLSFGPVTALDTIIVQAFDDDGCAGFGEATILTGYTPETIEGAWQAVSEISKAVVGMETDDAKSQALTRHAETPFSVTAVVTAIEMLEGHDVLQSPTSSVPLLAILGAMDESDIKKEITSHAAAGYTTIKVKIGWDLEDDLARTAFIQSCLPDGVSIRIDGNQGYSKEDGVAFASRVSPERVELLEQPCHMDDWDAAAALAKIDNVPFMLDESIYGDAEIERAAELGGVTHVKLKLMKAGSIDNLMRQLRRIRELGMIPVLGNGVASDPGCWMEACVAGVLVDNAGEMNGFLKPNTHLFTKPLSVIGGAIAMPTEMPRLIDLLALAVDHHTFSAT